MPQEVILRTAILFFVVTAPLFAQPSSYNSLFQYITNVEAGPDLALQDSGDALLMVEKELVTPQLWRFIWVGDAYQLSTGSFGEEQNYEPRELEDGWRIIRVGTGNFTGAAWELNAINSEEFTLSTEWLGPNMVLTMIADGAGTQTVTMAEYTGAANQRWRIEESTLALELLPTITPPHFIDAKNMWVSAPWTLSLRLPHPNSDGNDSFFDDLYYIIEIINKDNGDVLYEEPELRSDTWPVIRDYYLPESNFEIHIRRQGTFLRFHPSKAVVINGFSTRGGENKEPFYVAGYDRWLLHMPRTAGGFSAQVELRNTSPVATKVLLSPRDNAGFPFPPVEIEVPGNTRIARAVYGEDGLFADPQLLDQISHIGITEISRNVQVNLLTTADITGFGVWSQAVDLREPEATGTTLELAGATPNENYYLGVAILNLHNFGQFEVFIDQIDPASDTVVETISLGEIGIGQKILALPSLAFSTFIPNARYIVRNSNNQSMQAFGLTGSLDGSFIGEARITAIPSTPLVVKKNQTALPPSTQYAQQPTPTTETELHTRVKTLGHKTAMQDHQP